MDSHLRPYAGRWVALAGENIAGFGHTPDEALHMARRNRPKVRLTLQFVDPDNGTPLLLPQLYHSLRPFLAQTDQPIYLVGGAVRDALLGRLTNDLDFVLPHNAIKLTFQIADAINEPAYVLDRERDTGRIVLPDAHTYLDFARFRGKGLDEDLQDRDFTINAMAMPATATTVESIIDPYDGQTDLKNRRIRLVNDDALQRDSVRAMRAVRLALSLGFAIATETKTAVVQAAPLLKTASIERIRDEFSKMLATAVPDQAIQQMIELNLAEVVIPEIPPLAGIKQSPPHHEDVLAHTIAVLYWLPQVEACLQEQAIADPNFRKLQEVFSPSAKQLRQHFEREVDGGINGRILLRLGALFHDVGKASTQTIEENGRIRFLGHDKVGAEIAGHRLTTLRFSNEAIKHVEKMINAHMRPLLLAQMDKPASRRAIFRYFRDTDSAGLDVALLALADHLGTFDGIGHKPDWHKLIQIVSQLFNAYFEQYDVTVAPELLLNGRFVMQELNLKPGPEIGRLLRLLQEAQAAGEITTRAEAINFIHQTHQ